MPKLDQAKGATVVLVGFFQDILTKKKRHVKQDSSRDCEAHTFWILKKNKLSAKRELTEQYSAQIPEQYEVSTSANRLRLSYEEAKDLSEYMEVIGWAE